MALRPFSPSSFWTTQLPLNVPRHPSSALFVSNITTQLKRYYGAAAVNTTSYTAPVYVAPPTQPLVPVKYSNCQLKGWTDPKFLAQIQQIPMPPNAVPAKGTDGEMIIYQPSTDRVWELWRAEKRTDGWYACWGGLLEKASTTHGVYPYPYGVTATGLSLLGGMIQISELRQGRIDHVIDFAVPETRKGVFSWPANRTDGQVDVPTAIPQGLRFRLDPMVNLDVLGLHPVAKIMGKAMQRYGMILRDSSGSVSFYMENPQPLINGGGVNPYPVIFAGKPSYALLNNFPWNRLYALPMNYGQPRVAV